MIILYDTIVNYGVQYGSAFPGERQQISDYVDICCNMMDEFLEHDHINVDMRYCPYCGEAIVYQERRRLRYVNKTAPQWILEEENDLPQGVFGEMSDG